MNKKKIYSLWFLVPAVAIFVIFFIIPMVTSLFFSLTVWDLKSFTFCGFDNYKTFFSERSLSISVRNTLIYAFLTSGLKVIIAFFIALFLTSKIKTKDFLRSLVFFPNLVSAVAIGIIFKALMHPSKGLFNTLLAAIGISGPNWLGDTSLALFSVIAVDVWKGVSISTVIFIAGITSIDSSYYEAASIDGATGVQKFFRITIPLLRRSIGTTYILSLSGTINLSFTLSNVMTGGGPNGASSVLLQYMYTQGMRNANFGYAMAIAMFTLILAIVLAMISKKVSSEKE